MAFPLRPVSGMNTNVFLLGLFAEHFAVNLLLRTHSSSYQGNNELIFNLSPRRDSVILYLLDANLQYQCQKR